MKNNPKAKEQKLLSKKLTEEFEKIHGPILSKLRKIFYSCPSKKIRIKYNEFVQARGITDERFLYPI